MLCLNKKDKDENMVQLEPIIEDKGGHWWAGGLPRTGLTNKENRWGAKWIYRL